jgi:hypothetical protein
LPEIRLPPTLGTNVRVRPLPRQILELPLALLSVSPRGRWSGKWASSVRRMNDGPFVFNSIFLRTNHGNRSASRLRYSFGRPHADALVCLYCHRVFVRRIARTAFMSVSSSRRPCRSSVDRRERCASFISPNRSQPSSPIRRAMRF